jgi:multidrug efflux pump subunit AcrA (membrane-fusion protein)
MKTDKLLTEGELASTAAYSDAKSLRGIYVPSIFKYSIIFFAILLPVMLVLLLVMPWQQVAYGTGRVIAYAPENRQQAIEAPTDGRILEWLVHEGEYVEKGMPLVKLSDIDPDIISRLSRQREAMKINLKATRKALDVSRLNVERQKKLAEQGLSSRREYELSQLEVAKYASGVSEAEAKLAEMETKLSRQKSQNVVADQDGVLVRIYAPQGGVIVSAGEPLALLVPDTEDRAVELKIQGNDLPLVQQGRAVRLQFEGWPAVQFTGWPSVAVGTFGGVVRYVDHADDGTGYYRVLIFPDPDGDKWPEGHYLRQGVRTLGWILLDEVSFGWELWRRLNGFPMTVSEPAIETSKPTPPGSIKSKKVGL